MLTTADLAESAVTGKKDTTTIRLPPASMTAEFILTRNSEAFSPPTLILLMLSVMVLSFRISNVLYDPGPPTITLSITSEAGRSVMPGTGGEGNGGDGPPPEPPPPETTPLPATVTAAGLLTPS